MEDILRKYNIINRQRQLDKMFEEEELTDELLKMQIELNKEKNMFDINSEDKEFVQ